LKDVVEKSEAELAAALEKRKEQGKRLQEMQARQRAEKVSIFTPRAWKD
jgi:actin-related protein 5